MSTRVAAWLLLSIAVVCGLGGAAFASTLLDADRMDPAYLGLAVRNAMLATVLVVLCGAAVLGLIVLRGVAELLDQVATTVGRAAPTTGPVPAAQDPVDGLVA